MPSASFGGPNGPEQRHKNKSARKRLSVGSDKVWAERAATGKAADADRAQLKAQRLARDAAEKPSTPKGRAGKEKPPTGTKGEEISSQGRWTKEQNVGRAHAVVRNHRSQELNNFLTD
jgi:hypothetical protein